MARPEELKPNAIVRGAVFPEPVQVSVVVPMGDSWKLVGKGLRSGKFYDPVLSAAQVGQLEVTPEQLPFNGDAARFRLGVEALRLGLAFEYDPYFTLSIARVDPLPHQLEAVYDYFLKSPRIRFLLADDPGAGKTIMAGLLVKELKIRGLIKRILIVTPANLTFQWKREMLDRFRESFEIVRGDVLRSTYGTNPWQDRDQVITSVSWVSRVQDAKESLLRSRWDLIIVDEAHKMSASDQEHRTLAYQLGEALSELTDHFLLMTATPHKGNTEHFCMFLRLLDRDVYADVASLDEAMRRQSAPFYLRRVKEAMVSFPDPDTGTSKLLFTRRNVRTVRFQIDDDELELYELLTTFVEDQSIKASADNSARGRALGFTMAMLQRRFASSLYAMRRSLERMRDKRQKILDDPEAYRQELMDRKIPDDFEELTEEEQQEILADIEGVVASLDPAALRTEIAELTRLIDHAKRLEAREIESKLTRLKAQLLQEGVFTDPTMKLLVFTEHKDTLDYLLGKLRAWGLTVTQIHGGMKIGDRDTPDTRIWAEREFRDTCQVMVATEAAGEGINLQFCWLMVNYDIPWNPVRLEQRMGRIHRYGQEKDCLIYNFVSTNTREGRVLEKLFDRIEAIEHDLDPQRTGKVFNVLGDMLASNQIERMLRDMYAHNQMTEELIKSRITEQVDAQRFRKITDATLEGLAKRELNLAAIIGKSAEARERRLVPEVIEDFFVEAAPLASLYPKETRDASHVYRVGRVPRTLTAMGDRIEPRYGKLGREYRSIVFDKELLKKDATLEWVTPGHPLFEAVRADVLERTDTDLRNGAVFLDLHRSLPARMEVFCAAIRDGRGNELHRRLFVVEIGPEGAMTVRQPTLFLDCSPAPAGTKVPDLWPADRATVEGELLRLALQPFLSEVERGRAKDVETIRQHLEISLNVLVDRQNLRLADLIAQHEMGDDSPLLAANRKQTEDRVDELNTRLERRRAELERERQCTIADVQHLGSAWVLPHPDRISPAIAPMVRDPEIERIAVQAAIAYEQARGWVVESVEADNRGFDLISRRLHPEDPKTAIEIRFIEVKGRAGVGEVALTTNEYRTAERLQRDYWLYVVYNCGSTPEVHAIQDPARLSWEAVVRVQHYLVGASSILAAEE